MGGDRVDRGAAVRREAEGEFLEVVESVTIGIAGLGEVRAGSEGEGGDPSREGIGGGDD